MILSTVIVVLLALLFSAFFSGMEIAFLASNKLKLEIEKSRSHAFAYIAGLFSRHPGQYITTILVGNNIALVIYSLQMSLLIQTLLSLTGWGLLSGGSFLLETVLSTIIIIFAAEYIPKAVVRLNPNLYYRTFAVPVFLFYLLFYPLARITTFISTLILRIFGLPVNTRRGAQTFDRIDLAHLIDEASEGDEQYDNEKDIRLFQNFRTCSCATAWCLGSISRRSTGPIRSGSSPRALSIRISLGCRFMRRTSTGSSVT